MFASPSVRVGLTKRRDAARTGRNNAGRVWKRMRSATPACVACSVDHQRLEQRREPRSRIRPRHRDLAHAVLRALHAGSLRDQVGPVLHRVQVPPTPLPRVASPTRPLTRRIVTPEAIASSVRRSSGSPFEAASKLGSRSSRPAIDRTRGRRMSIRRPPSTIALSVLPARTACRSASCRPAGAHSAIRSCSIIAARTCLPVSTHRPKNALFLQSRQQRQRDRDDRLVHDDQVLARGLLRGMLGHGGSFVVGTPSVPHGR
jgi:hypothetical protein